jgi:hypothetical protein
MPGNKGFSRSTWVMASPRAGDVLVTSLADESSVQKTIKAASVRWTLSARPGQYLDDSYVDS